ncbi:uncharacterized protein CHSO_4369 [Chryseobacterium sp. StRB126]|uniref:hypothetical protein n=1 Tax=Chryseobacterium sp. StRB126 TaxID=878220 RepID=UPI0004E99345|nr:hypothetical protein [Chryseobacterium sp. StRB126]BAP33406.1 uncharacterized protein CHSO_4369 [Chryseobacterium sp. StRB126]
MLEIIILFVLTGLAFLFMLYALFMLVIKKKKNFKYPIIISLIAFISLGCFTLYQTATKTYNKIDDLLVKGASKTGEITGKTVTAFGKSAYDGAGTVLKNKTVTQPSLKEKGIEIGKIEQDENNILQVYIIFNKDFKGNVMVKIKDINNEEIGRSTHYIEGKSGQATYESFIFEQPTDIQGQSTIFLE